MNFCRVCKGTLTEIWPLHETPYGDLFQRSEVESKALQKVGLTLGFCESCNLLQLVEEVNLDEIYLDYLYESSITTGLNSLYQRVASNLVSRFELTANDLVVDVDSNDGTGLKPFHHLGTKVLGIEPSKGPAATAIKNDIKTINSYLDEKIARQVVEVEGAASLVTANYVTANVPDPVKFLTDMRGMLRKDGVVSLITGYHPDLFAVNMFDYINHDHLCYFTLESLTIVANQAGLRPISVNRIDPKGGSIHILLVSIDSSLIQDETIDSLKMRERWLEANSPRLTLNLLDRIDHLKNILNFELGKFEKNKIAGIGASISTTTLLHQFQIGDKFEALFDDDSSKINKYSPGFGLKVYSLDSLSKFNFELAVVLSWQHTNVLINRIRQTNFNGKILIPLPDIKLDKF